VPLGHERPDETTIQGAAVRCLAGDCSPPNFFWPSLYAYLVTFVYLGYYWLSGASARFPTLAAFAESRRTDVRPFFLLNRGLSAAMGTLSVLATYRLAARTFDRAVGLVAALYLGMAFLHVRDSHFGVTDVTMTALVTLDVLLVTRWQRSGRRGDALAAGLVAGLAASVKYNAALLWAPFIAACLVAPRPGRRALAARGAAWFGPSFLLGFFAGSPFILLEWPRFTQDVAAQATWFRDGHGVPLEWGWIHHARVTLPQAVGWPIYVAGLAGAAALLGRHARQAAVLLAFPILYYAVAGSGRTVFARYMLPVLPFLATTAAWATVSCVRASLAAWAPRTRAAVCALLACCMVAPSAAKVVAFDRVLSRPDSRYVAGRALLGIVRPGETLYQSGVHYGHAMLEVDGRRVPAVEVRYDEATGRFAGKAGPIEGPPDWVVLQRSELPGQSQAPPAVEALVREHFHRVAVIEAYKTAPGRVYDLQDAFFLPLAGFAGVERPGPNFEIYRRRRATHAPPEDSSRLPAGRSLRAPVPPPLAPEAAPRAPQGDERSDEEQAREERADQRTVPAGAVSTPLTASAVAASNGPWCSHRTVPCGSITIRKASSSLTSETPSRRFQSLVSP
jgi:hypothetical protein